MEGIYFLYKNVINYFECNFGLRNSFGVDGFYILFFWKIVVFFFESNSLKIFDNIWLLNVDLNDLNNLYDVVVKICKFVVVSIAKDCFLMVVF